MTALPEDNRTLPRMTVEEYLAFEETAELRHEFIHGEVRAMSGGTGNHSRLKIRLGGMLDRALQDGPCEPLDSDFRVSVKNRGQYRYPDVSVFCGGVETPPDEKRELTGLNPTALFEVLSPSTELEDRSRKLEFYAQIPTLKLYALVHSERVKVEWFERHEGGLWAIQRVEGLDAEAAYPSIGYTLPLRALYRDMAFDVDS